MERARYISHGTKKILLLDFSECSPQQILETIEVAKPMIHSQPAQSVLTLTDVTNAHYDREVTDALKHFTKNNKPYVKAGAVVGLDGLKKIVYKGIMLFSGRNIEIFDNRHQAESWLRRQ